MVNPRRRGLATDATQRYERVFGRNHLFTLAAKVNLAVILRATGDASMAHDIDRTSVTVMTDAVGADHHGKRAECDIEPPPS